MITLGGKVIKKVDLVLRLFNDYDMSEIKNAGVTLNGMNYKRITKDGGYYVYIGLQERKYEIKVTHSEFMDKEVLVDLKKLNPLDPIVNLRLKPSVRDFFERDGVIIKLATKDTGEEIKAFIEDFAVGEITRDVAENRGIIYLESYFNDIIFGETLYIDDGESSEFIQVSSSDKNKFKIDTKLLFPHKKGVKIKKAFQSQSDEKGNGLVYFKNLIKKKNKINILVGESSMKTEVDIDSFNTYKDLGTIKRAE